MVRRQGRAPRTVVDATISVIGNSDPVQSAIGQPAGEVKQSVSDNADWREVEDQFRAVLKGISDANLVRRQRLTLLTARAYIIGLQVARDPENAELRPHLDEVKRQKVLARRKKSAKPAPAPQGPPTTPPAPQPSTLWVFLSSMGLRAAASPWARSLASLMMPSASVRSAGALAAGKFTRASAWSCWIRPLTSTGSGTTTLGLGGGGGGGAGFFFF